jgi:hypothetical protein
LGLATLAAMSRSLMILSGVVVILATSAAAVGLYGSNVYRNDTLFFAEGFRGQDAVTLVVAVPLLVGAAVGSRAGSRRARLLLAGALAYFLYVYASMALGAAYNWLFLVYVALLSTSLFAFVGAVAARDLRFTAAPPRLAPAIFMLVCGLVTAFVWLGPLVVAALERRPPDRLDGYTTMVTYALDLAIVAPATWVSAR